MLSTKLRDQIFVSLCIVTIGEVIFEVFVSAVFSVIHIARVPFVLRSRNGVDAPVNEDAELGVLVPLRLLILDQRRPVGAVRSIVRLPVGLGEQAIALRVVLTHGLLPLAINLLGGLDVLRWRERIGG